MISEQNTAFPVPLRVLVACEYSSIVRDAFLEKGHDAWSCDLLPTERNSNRHFQCDVREGKEAYPNSPRAYSHGSSVIRRQSGPAFG